MNYYKFFWFLLFWIGIHSQAIYAQVGIGTLNPNSSAILHLESTEKGFLPPVMTQTERDNISAPTEGLTVYCTDCSPSGYYVYIPTSWVTIVSTSSSLGLLSDNNNNAHGNLNNLMSTTGGSNVALGVDAMESATSASENTAVGILAMKDITSGYANTAIGASSMRNITTGNYNTAIGHQALPSATAGSGNVGIGYSAGQGSTGSNNVFLGNSTGYSSASTGGVFIGYEAGYNESGDNLLYIENSNSSTPLIGGDFSTNKVGINTSVSNLTSGATLQVGGSISLENGATIYGFSTDGTLGNNSDTLAPTEKAIKNYVDNYSRLGLVDGGNSNVHGNNTNLTNITTGYNNTAIGSGAMSSITTGGDNVAIGGTALNNIGGGINNVGIGVNAGYTTAGSDNVLIGNSAGAAGTGSNNVFLGSSTGFFSGSSSSVFIGKQAGYNESGDNLLYIENSNSSSPLIGGNFSTNQVGINTSASNLTSGATLQVGGSISLENGATIYGFNTDGTFSDNSDTLVPTQKAVASYITSYGASNFINQSSIVQSIGSSASATSVPSELAVKDYVDANTASAGLIDAGFDNLHGNNNNLVSSTGNNNMALGFYAMNSATSAVQNTAIGNDAMRNISSGAQNTALGLSAMTSISTGTGNTAVGSNALSSISGGSYNVGIGLNAGYNNTGNENVMIGNSAGTNNSGSKNVFLGDSAGYSSSASTGSVFIGNEAGYSESEDSLLYIENSQSSTPLIGGDFSTNKVGINTMASNLNSGATLQVGGSISLENGADIYGFSTDGNLASASDTLVPTQKAVKDYVDGNISSPGLIDAGSDNIHGNNSNLTSSSGSKNLALGSNAMQSATTGSSNTAIGYDAMQSITIGDNNAALGQSAMSGLTTGLGNSAIGSGALQNVVGGNNNVGVGLEAGQNASGNENVLLGYQAGKSATGSDNIFLGSGAGHSSTSTNSIFIGKHAGYSESEDNSLYIENGSPSTPLIGGNFATDRVGINIDVANLISGSTLQVGGTASNSDGLWAVNSDRRLKTNIQYMEAEEMLNKMLQLKGASYEWNDTVTAFSSTRPEGIQYGFIAQDIEKVWPSEISRDDQGYLMTSYGNYDPMFVESLRALNNKIAELKQYVGQLEKDNERLKEEKDLQMSKLLKRLEKLESTPQ